MVKKGDIHKCVPSGAFLHVADENLVVLTDLYDLPQYLINF